MKVTQKQNRNQLQVVCQEVLKVKEEIGMKMTRQITYVMTRLYKGLSGKAPVKILVVLAGGALMLAATLLPTGTLVNQSAASKITASSIDFTAEPYLLFEEYEWGDLVEPPQMDHRRGGWS